MFAETEGHRISTKSLWSLDQRLKSVDDVDSRLDRIRAVAAKLRSKRWRRDHDADARGELIPDTDVDADPKREHGGDFEPGAWSRHFTGRGHQL